MNKQSLEVLEEYGDDIHAICMVVIELRDSIDEKNNQIDNLQEKIDELQEEINNHECE